MQRQRRAQARVGSKLRAVLAGKLQAPAGGERVCRLPYEGCRWGSRGARVAKGVVSGGLVWGFGRVGVVGALSNPRQSARPRPTRRRTSCG